MSRRLGRHVTCTILLVVFTAHPASAQDGFWRWLEKLSGPGPYSGWGVTLTPFCFGTEKQTRIAEDPSRATILDITPFQDWGCGRASRNHFRAMIRFELARLSAGDNELIYDPPRTAGELQTRAFSFVPAVDFGVNRWLEIGAGLGFIRFTGDAFDAFSKPAIQVVRLTAKPLLVQSRPADSARRVYGLEFLQVRYVATLIPDGFEAQEFGAVPGTFSTGTEFLSSLSVVVDVFPLIELLRRQ